MTTDQTEAIAELRSLYDQADGIYADWQKVKAEIREKEIALAEYKVGDEAINKGKKVRIASVRPRGYQTRDGSPAIEYQVNRMKKDGTYGKGVFHVYGGLEPVTPE